MRKHLSLFGWSRVLALTAISILPQQSQAADPVLVGQWPGFARGPAQAVVVTNNTAYVAAGPGGLVILDVSDPTKPVRVGEYDNADGAYGVAVAGSYAYVAANLTGLLIIDVSNPANPVRVGGCDTPGPTSGVTVAGNYAYVAASYAGLQIIDVSNPTNCVRVGGYDTAGSSYGVAVAGEYAFVADGNSGLQVIEVSDPSNPVRVGGWAIGWAVGVALAGNYAYVTASSDSLRVIDVSNPVNPVQVGMSTGVYNGAGVTLAGNYAYVADLYSGLLVVEVSDPANPLVVGRCATGGVAAGVAVAGDYVYVAAGSAGLQVIDVSHPTNSVRVGAFETHGDAGGVAVAGNYAYVADGIGLRVIDVSHPSNPVRAGGCDTPGKPTDVAVAGPYAYVADGVGLQVIDVSIPTNCVRVGGMGWQPRGVAVAGQYAYAVGGSGLEVIDVGNPAAPVRAGHCSITGYASRVAVSGQHAYVAASEGGLQVVDISDPTNPVRVGGFAAAYVHGVAVAGNYAHVAADALGLLVIDVSNPANPVRVGACDTPGWAQGVAVAGNYAYVADHGVGLQVIDVSNPTNPVRVGGCGLTYSRNLVLAGPYAYVAEGYQGLSILRITDDPGTNTSNLWGWDDFNDNTKDETKWGADVAPAGCQTAVLQEVNQRLELTSSSTLECGVFRPWILNSGSYTQDWEVTVDVHLGAVDLAENASHVEVLLGAWNVSDKTNGFGRDHLAVALDLYRDTQATVSRTFTGYARVNGVDVLGGQVQQATTATRARLRISYDAAATTLRCWHDGGGAGSGWQELRSVNVAVPASDWEMGPAARFEVALGGSCRGIALASAHAVYLDNFNATSPDAFSFEADSDVITNAWLGLCRVGDSYSLAGVGTFAGATRTWSLIGRETVLDVKCAVLRVVGHGTGAAAAEFYDLRLAQDTRGNLRVLKLTGMESDGSPVNWTAPAVAQSSMFFPSDPQLGSGWNRLGEAHEVLAVKETVPQLSTGFGPIGNCVQVRVSREGGADLDSYWFAPGVGAVKELWNDGGEHNGWERMPGPVVLGVARAGAPGSEHLVFSVESLLGRSYQLLSKTNLTQGNWQAEGAATLGTGGVLKFTNSITPHPQKFFILKQTP